jgi:hypothetical protein
VCIVASAIGLLCTRAEIQVAGVVDEATTSWVDQLDSTCLWTRCKDIGGSVMETEKEREIDLEVIKSLSRTR